MQTRAHRTARVCVFFHPCTMLDDGMLRPTIPAVGLLRVRGTLVGAKATPLTSAMGCAFLPCSRERMPPCGCACHCRCLACACCTWRCVQVMLRDLLQQAREGAPPAGPGGAGNSFSISGAAGADDF